MPAPGLTPGVQHQVCREERRDGQRHRRIEKVKWERPNANGLERYRQQTEAVTSSGENGFRQDRCQVESFASDTASGKVRQTHCRRVAQARTSDGWALSSSTFQFVSSTTTTNNDDITHQVSGICPLLFDPKDRTNSVGMDLDIVEVFPQLDNSPQKCRSELAQKGSLGHRRPPTRAGIRAFVSSVWEGNDHTVSSSDSPPPTPSPDPLPQNGNHSDSEVPPESPPIRGWKRPPKHAVLVFPMQLLSANNKFREDDDESPKEQVKGHHYKTLEEDEEQGSEIERRSLSPDGPPPTKTGPTIVSITLKNPEKNVISVGDGQPTQVLIRPYAPDPTTTVMKSSGSDDRRSWTSTTSGAHSTVVFLNREDTPSPNPSSRTPSPAQERIARRDSQRNSNVHIQTWERRRASPSPSPSPSRARLRDLVTTRPASLTGDEGLVRSIPSPFSRRSSPSSSSGHPRYLRSPQFSHSESSKPEWLRKIDLERRRGIDWENLEKQRREAEKNDVSPTRSEPRGRSSSDSFLLERDSISRRSDGCKRWTPPSEPEWIQIARRRRQNRINWETIDERPSRHCSDPPTPRRQQVGVETGEDVAVQVNLSKKKTKPDSGSIIQSILSKIRGGNDADLRNLPIVVHSSSPLASGASRRQSPDRLTWRRPKKEASPPKWTEPNILIEDLPTVDPQPKQRAKNDSSPRRGKALHQQKSQRLPLRVRSPSPPRRRQHQAPSSSPSSSESDSKRGPDTPSSKKKVRFMISGDKLKVPVPTAGYTLFGMDQPAKTNPSGNKENVPLVDRGRVAKKPTQFSEGNTSHKIPAQPSNAAKEEEPEDSDDYQLQAYRIIRHIKQMTKEKQGKGSRDSSPETASGRRTPEWMRRAQHKPSVNWESLEERPGIQDDNQPPSWAQFQLKRTPFSKKYLLRNGQATENQPWSEEEEPDQSSTKQEVNKRSEANPVDSEGYSSMESSGGPVCVQCGRPQEMWTATACAGIECDITPHVASQQKPYKRGPQTKTVRKTLRRILRAPNDQKQVQQGDEEIVEEITEEEIKFDVPSKMKAKKHVIRTVQTKDGHCFLTTTIAAADGTERG